MRKTHQISEYGSFISSEREGYYTLEKKTFEQLENFILSNKNKETDALELMSISAKKGIGKVITAKNYVGIISMKDGTTIEILPKIFSKSSDNILQVKKLLVDMLKSLRNSPYKSLQTSQLDVEKMDIFEIFIRMFFDEVLFIVKRGLKSSYETVSKNETVFKGKLLFLQQIRHNFAHKERVYVEFDEFNNNRPENKLIKSTLLYLYRQIKSVKNKNDIKILLNAFDEVEPSSNYKKDYLKFSPDRNMKDYCTALLWCRVFLMGKSFTSFSGSNLAFALLFPMEKLFESYIETQMRKVLDSTKYKMSAQDRSYHLFTLPSKKFLIKPDIVVKRKVDDAVFICDTKWKILSDTKANHGISQSDMYQMYAYQKKYSAKHITLIYPLTDKVEEKDIYFDSTDGTIVRVRFVDLLDIKNSLEEIIQDF